MITAERLQIARAQALALAKARQDRGTDGFPDRLTFAGNAGLPPDPWQADFLTSDENRILVNCHRQSGKSSIAATLAIHGAFTEPNTLQILLSPGLRQSGELFRKCADVYHKAGALVTASSETALTLTLANGARIVSLPGNEATVRGYSGVRRIIVDEAARVPDALYRAVRPMLAVSGGQLIAMSTPWGKRGWWYEAWESTEHWRRFTVTADRCPRINPEFLAEEKRTMPRTWFEQEYMCVFGDMQGQIFPTDLIMTAFSDEIEPLFPDLERAVIDGISDDIQPLFGAE